MLIDCCGTRTAARVKVMGFTNMPLPQERRPLFHTMPRCARMDDSHALLLEDRPDGTVYAVRVGCPDGDPVESRTRDVGLLLSPARWPAAVLAGALLLAGLLLLVRRRSPMGALWRYPAAWAVVEAACIGMLYYWPYL
jgi:hypothetical protein